MLEIKNVKKIQIRRSRFGYESKSEYYSSCKNHESESEYSGFGEKDSNPNPNPNIRYNTVTYIHTPTHVPRVLWKCNKCMPPAQRN